MLKILVASCDKDADTFEAFHHCIEKYWPEHPEVVYSTETVINPYYKTISKNYDIKHWTTRIRETAEMMPADHILLMCDDIFIRERVDDSKINKLCTYITGNIAILSLNKSQDSCDMPFELDSEVLERSKNGLWKLSLSDSIWSRQKLIELMSYDTDPWTFETKNDTHGYKCLVANNKAFINRGADRAQQWFALHRGKWCVEIIDFFEQEGINVDYSKRGFFDMKYVIMCGGTYNNFETPKQLLVCNGERIADRTIRLLTENRIDKRNIYISTNNQAFESCGVKLLKNANNRFSQDKAWTNMKGWWLDAFYPMACPTCYLFGDVYYSEDAIKKIVEAKCNDYLMAGTNIKLSGSAVKKYDEPLAFKVTNQDAFKKAISDVKQLSLDGKIRRHPIAWELYRYLSGYDINTHILGKNYLSILDYSTDIDSKEDVKDVENFIKCLNIKNNEVCFGIPSYIPDGPYRQKRIEKVQACLDKITKDFNIPIIIVAQNWNNDIKIDKSWIVFNYDKLGITGARKELRYLFLNSIFKHLIMLDDEIDYECKSAKEFIEWAKTCDGWAESGFNLQFFTISKSLYSIVDFPDIDVVADHIYEDRVFIATLKEFYKKLERRIPSGMINPKYEVNRTEQNFGLSSWWDGKHETMVQFAKNTDLYIAKNIKGKYKQAKAEQRADGRANCYLYF